MKNRVNRASSEAKKNLSFCSSEAKKNLSFCSSEAKKNLSFCSSGAKKNLSFSSSEAKKNLSFSSSGAKKNNCFFTMRAEKELSAIRGEQTLFIQPTNHPLITHLSPTFGSRLDAIRKYAAMVVLMLFIGVGQMWGYTMGGTTLYVDNYGKNWSSIMIHMWSGDWSTDWKFTQISGTDYWSYNSASAYDYAGYLWATENYSSKSGDITADGAQSSWYTKCYSLQNNQWTVPGQKSVSYTRNSTTTANTLAGSGTSGSPYIIKTGTAIGVELSGTAIDANCTKYYKFGSSAASTTNTKQVVASCVAGTTYSMQGYTGAKRGEFESRYASAGTLYFKAAYTISAAVSGENGSVSITSGGNYVYTGNTSFTVTATPDSGYEVETWTVTGGTKTGSGNSITVSASNSANCTVTVTFRAIPASSHTISYTTVGTGWSYGTAPSSAEADETVTFVVNPTAGYTVSVTSSDVTLYGPNASNQYTFTMPDDDVAITVSATENKRDVTISAGTGGTVDKTSASVGIVTTTTVTATAYPGYRFTGWTATNCSVASSLSASTTLSGDGTTGDATLVANFTRTYSYIQGRMTVYNATRTSETHVGSSKGSWDENSTRVAMEYDETNHRFLRHTYKTPAELSATQTDGTAQSQWFSIARSNTSGSWSGKTTYHPSSNTDLTTTGSENKKAAQTSTKTSNYKFNSATTTGYVILYFDEAGVWYELEQTLKYNGNGNTGGTAPAGTVYYNKGTDATAASNTYTKTGYTFNGWNTAANGSGTSYAAGVNVPMNSNITLYAQWAANPYTVTLDVDEEHKGTIAGATTSQSVTYNAATTTVPNRPTGAQGYGLDGYYTDHNGAGTKLINGDGKWIASVAGYTDADKKWIHDGDVTLYAYYKQSVITGITFTGGSSVFDASGSRVEVTANFDPEPDGATVVCWRVLYSNNNPLESQPTFSPASGTTVSFNAPTTPGSYQIEATLRTGSVCGSGTVLSTYKEAFQIASDHTVTVQYKCDDNVIAASTTTSGKPLEWTEVVAHEIFGYTFSGWTAGDGITIEAVTAARLAALKAADATVAGATKMKAIYDGKLTANYTKKDFIYFKSTALNWNDVYVYFYTDGGYWDNNLGAGATGAACIGKGKMDLVPGETDVYYWDYGAHIAGGASAATKYVAFTWGDCTGHNNFNGKSSCYPMNGNNQGFSSGTPMFVPIAQNENYRKNNNATPYFDRGYWTRYTGGTGYSVDIFYANGTYDKSFDFVEGATAGMPYTATVYLNGGSNLYFKVHRSSNIYYYSTTNVTMSNATTSKALTYDSGANKTTITTNVAGEYTFTLTCGSDGKLNVSVKYPAATGDYRLVYSDGTQTKPLVSDIVPKVNNGKDTVSFFVRPGKSPVLKVQQASISGSTLRWDEGTNITTAAGLTSLAKDSVYNICLKMDGTGAISVENVEGYTGNYYIRTDAANNKWDNYRASDHVMTYSEYSELNSDFTHYWVKFVSQGTNVKFVVANDYSPNISDTLIQQTYRGGDSYHVDDKGSLSNPLDGEGVNIRYMWHRKTNAVIRAYLAPAQRDGSKFLVLRANSATDLMDEDGHALALTSSNNHGAPNNSMQFTDDENWIYETTVMVKPGAYVKLYGYFHDKYFYFKGNDNNNFNGTEVAGNPNAIQLITGSGDAQKVRVIFDFKTDRLLAAWLPSGEIDEAKEINADVMFIREHQGDMAQLTFSGEGKITAIKSAYGVMRFNKWTLNNKDKSTHTVLGSPKSIYERSLYFISFPFRVKLNDVFGFGKYMEHWAIQKYNGARRAAEGFWLESSGFWEWMDRNTEYLEPNQGYLLAIDLDLLGEDNHDIWGPESRSEQIELYFPSYGDMPNITSANVTQTIPSHACEIDWSERPNGHGGTLGPEYNRTIIDSHWNVLSVPTYVNTSNIAFANTEWTTAIGPNFLYTWNMDDNTLTATAADGYTYHAMHAYMVQYGGNVTWSASSGSPYPIVARRTYAEKPKETSFCMEIQQEGKMIDRTYVVLSSDEETKTEFSFGEDMGKEFNTRNANIYTVVENYIPTAGNTLPMSEQTTVVPVGVKVNKAGEFTFAMPEGTEGTGAVLVDNTTGTRTNLALTDYTVTLEKGDCEGRFTLEISPVANTPTGNLTPAISQGDGEKVRKVIVDGVLYIVKDDKIYDARGNKIN